MKVAYHALAKSLQHLSSIVRLLLLRETNEAELRFHGVNPIICFEWVGGSGEDRRPGTLKVGVGALTILGSRNMSLLVVQLALRQ